MDSKLFNINRRNFLKGSFASLVFSSFGLYGFELMNPTRPYKIGLIGTGWYGKSDLFKMIQVTRVEVIALCDVDKKQLSSAADLVSKRQNSLKKPLLYNDYREMLSENKFDIILIGTPDHWHALQAIAALESGAHVYLQKPISVDVIEGEAVVAAAKKYNKVVQVGLQRRSTPHLIEAKEQIIKGKYVLQFKLTLLVLVGELFSFSDAAISAETGQPIVTAQPIADLAAWLESVQE